MDFKIDRKSPSTTFELFGFNIPNNLQTLTFRNVKKKLLPLVTKNKLEFIKLIKDQKDLYKKILQKSNS